MATMAENERLAVLENQYRTLQSDVTEIKSDVKALVATQATLATALAVKEAADTKERQSRASTGVWVRTILPLVAAIAALVLAIINTAARLGV
jgi:prefoldin subunit 5